MCSEDVGRKKPEHPATPIAEEQIQPEAGAHELRAIRRVMELHNIQQGYFMQLTQSKLTGLQERILLQMQEAALLQERSNIILSQRISESQKKPVDKARSGAEANLCQACSHHGRLHVESIRPKRKKPKSLEPTTSQEDHPPMES